jgi:hypothetical protein
MAMKKFLRFFLLTLFCMLVLAACAPTAIQSLVGPLPDEAQNLIFILLTAGVAWVLMKLSEVFKIDLSGYTNAIAVALAPIIVAVIERWLEVIPPAFDNIVLTIIHLVVLLIGSIGTFFLLQRKVPQLR